MTKEERREYMRQYRLNHPEKIRENNRRYREYSRRYRRVGKKRSMGGAGFDWHQREKDIYHEHQICRLPTEKALRVFTGVLEGRITIVA